MESPVIKDAKRPKMTILELPLFGFVQAIINLVITILPPALQQDVNVENSNLWWNVHN